jgi:hypothetical protein
MQFAPNRSQRLGTQHLSDEAVAAFADGVLTGHVRERALRHTEACAECAQAVAVQREAVWALRAAPSPALPSGLVERLRGLPDVTPIHTVPTVIDQHGNAMISAMAPAAALVGATSPTPNRVRPVAGAAVALAVVGVLAAGSAAAVGNGSGPAPRGPVEVRPAPNGVPAAVVQLPGQHR